MGNNFVKKMLRITPKGIEISVKVVPHSKKETIVGWEGDSLKIRLRSPPEKNKANEELIEFLALLLDLPKSNIQILKGFTSRIKRILFIDLNFEKAKILLKIPQ
jgi:uncharacterized protein